jgi:hypothetical protein
LKAAEDGDLDLLEMFLNLGEDINQVKILTSNAISNNIGKIECNFFIIYT